MSDEQDHTAEFGSMTQRQIAELVVERFMADVDRGATDDDVLGPEYLDTLPRGVVTLIGSLIGDAMIETAEQYALLSTFSEAEQIRLVRRVVVFARMSAAP